MVMRIGQSTDIHRFVSGRKLILGGVEIPYDQGLAGHSDADVLLHAIAEAIIGALGLGDLGEHFPDTLVANKGLDSRFILNFTAKLLADQGYSICNIDSLLVCESPKLLPYKQQMRKNIAEILAISLEQINVKATTGEGIGFVGRQEGIMAEAIVLIEKDA